MIEMSNKRPPIAINKGKRKSLAALLFLLVSNDKCNRYHSDISDRRQIPFLVAIITTRNGIF